MRLALMTFSLVMVLAGAFYVLMYHKQMDAASSFVPVEAVITHSDTITQNKLYVRGASVVNIQAPDISYNYTIDGKVYVSTRYSYSSGESIRHLHYDDLVKAMKDSSANWHGYTVGQNVTAYVDPDDPRHAILDISMKGTKAALIFGVVLILSGTLLAVVILRLN